MIDVSISINGVNVEGVSPSSVKLTINNSDPLKFTDRTVAYSASVSVPRTEVNDRIFKEMRTPWLFVKQKMYVALLSFGGLPAPINGGKFKAKVTAKQDGYTVELVELFTKFASIASSFGGLLPKYAPSNDVYWVIDYNDALKRAYPSIYIPEQKALNRSDVLVTATMNYYTNTSMVKASDFLNSSIVLKYRNSSDGDYQSRYPHSYLWCDTSDTAVAARKFGGQVWQFKVAPESFITLDPTFTGDLRFRLFTPSVSAWVTFQPKFQNRDGTMQYGPAGNTVMSLTLNGGDIQGEFYNGANQRVLPTLSLPVEDAVGISITLNSVSAPDATTGIIGSPAFTSGYELLMAYCKAFAWTYDYNQDTNTVVLKPFIDPTVTQSTSPKRIDWTGKIDPSTVEVSEMDGIARSMIYTIGERKYRFKAYDGALDSSAEGGTSALPVKQANIMPHAAMTIYNSPTDPMISSYFNNARSYRADIGDYYMFFRKGYQVKCTAYLTYFDIQNFKNDACYKVGELNEFFYLRTISNWDASTGKCNLTLIALDLLGAGDGEITVPDAPVVTISNLGQVNIS